MTTRQEQILASIVETYAQTAEPVGSLALSRQIECSPATVRAEMAVLEQLGLITHPHTSAGRIPTDAGYRHYVNGLRSQPRPSRAAQAIDRQIRDAGEMEQAFKNAAELLAQATSNLAIVSLLDRYYQFGLSRLFRLPEFYGRLEAYEVARLIDELPRALADMAPYQGGINVRIGHENPIGKGAGVSTIVARIQTPGTQGFIGLIGPTRQNYREVVSLMEHVTRTLEEELDEQAA